MNTYHNGHPDLLVPGMYPDNFMKSADEGVEVKATKNRVADTHGARHGWVLQVNYVSDPSPDKTTRRPTLVKTLYLAQVTEDLFRRNERAELGTRTATLDKRGLQVLRAGIIYSDPSGNPPKPPRGGRRSPALFT